jgi:hypothetical protein
MSELELKESKKDEINHNKIPIIYVDDKDNDNKQDNEIVKQENNNQNDVNIETHIYLKNAISNRRPSGWFKESTKHYLNSASSVISGSMKTIKEDDIQSTCTNQTNFKRRKSIQPQAAFVETEEALKAKRLSIYPSHNHNPNHHQHHQHQHHQHHHHNNNVNDKKSLNYSDNQSILQINNIENENINKDEFMDINSISVKSVRTSDDTTQENGGLLDFTKIVTVAYGLLMSIIGCATCIAIAISKKSDKSISIFRDVININSNLYKENLFLIHS